MILPPMPYLDDDDDDGGDDANVSWCSLVAAVVVVSGLVVLVALVSGWRLDCSGANIAPSIYPCRSFTEYVGYAIRSFAQWRWW